MPRIPDGAKTTDLAPMVNAARQSGFLSRVGQAVRYAIAGVTPQTWMSPNQPVAPVAQEAAGRRLDYPVGYNLVYTPRSGELTSFQQLRALAENCDLVRLAIETRKDQIASLQWTVGHVDESKDVADDADAKKVIAMLRKPDGVHGWQTWLRMAMEEVLTIDALSIVPQKTNGGGLFGFELIDGATIKVLSNADGRTPKPPSVAYQQVIKGMPAVDYTADELVYATRNPRVSKFYGYSPVEQILMTVNIALRRAYSQLQYFTEGSIPAAYATLPKEWTPQNIREFQEYWDAVVEGDQAQKRKVRFVAGDTKVTTLRDAPLKDEFDEWIARIVCYAFSLPPTAFVKQMNRATSDTQQEAALSEGLAPLTIWVKELMDDLIAKYFGREDLEFRWVEQEALDPQSQTVILTTYQKTGVYSINEIRAKLGEEPIEGEGGDAYLIFTATGATPVDRALEPPPEPVPPADPNAPKPGEPKPPEPKTDEPKPAQKLEHSHLAKADAPLTAQEKRVNDAFELAFGEVRDVAMKAAGSLHKAAGADGADGHYSRDAEELAAWEGFVDQLDLSGLSLAFDDLSDTLVAVAPDGARHEVARIVAADPSLKPDAVGASFDFLDHVDPEAIEWAKQHAAKLIASDGSGGELLDSTRDMVKQTITAGIENHYTDKQMVQALHDAYAFSPERAALIARTEIGNAQVQGGFIGAKAVGMQEKRWLKSNSEGVCPACDANAAQGYIPITQAFSSGDEAPLAHPRCRCDTAYRRKPN